VEDNELNMEIAREILKEEGAEITEAENGQIRQLIPVRNYLPCIPTIRFPPAFDANVQPNLHNILVPNS
jgi:CheY-like chemotaxis protein